MDQRRSRSPARVAWRNIRSVGMRRDPQRSASAKARIPITWSSGAVRRCSTSLSASPAATPARPSASRARATVGSSRGTSRRSPANGTGCRPPRKASTPSSARRISSPTDRSAHTAATPSTPRVSVVWCSATSVPPSDGRNLAPTRVSRIGPLGNRRVARYHSGSAHSNASSTHSTASPSLRVFATSFTPPSGRGAKE